MDGLERYRDQRLELGDATRALLYLARARHDEKVEADCRHLLKRLAEDRFTVVVVGQHSRGKTTLMNALLGAQLLPTGILPMTSVITLVRYGSEPRAMYFRRGSDIALHTEVKDVPALVARESVVRSELEVNRVELELPAELLRLGLTFVDTPGVGSTDETGAAATRRFLPEADAVLFVTSVDSAMTDAELSLLRSTPHSAPVFCVVNKADLASDEEIASVVGFVRRALRESAGREADEVFAVSALHGLQHRVGGIEGTADDGGVDAFQSQLEATLIAARGPVTLANAVDNARSILNEQQRMFDLADRFAQLVEGDAARLRAAVAASVEQSATTRIHVIAALKDDAQRTLDAAIAASRPAWRAALLGALRPGGIADPEETQHTAGTRRWWSALTASLSEASAAAMLRHRVALGETLGTGLSTALEFVGLAHDTVSTPWESQELPGFGSPRAAFDDDDVPATRLARSRKQREKEVDRLLDDFDAHLRQQNEHRAGWVEHDAGKRAEANGARLDAYLARAPSEFERDALARAARRLDTVEDVLRSSATQSVSVARPVAERRPFPTPRSTTARSPERETTTRRAPFDCVVCARERTALIEDLRHRQLFLATRERDQSEFARIGGLCAQHTWTYASIASPVGIASAYAPLASRAAQMLDAAPTASSVRESTAAFGGDAESCPVCRTVADAERDALWELNASDGDASVCMRHLEAATAVGLRTSVLLGLAHRLAENLHRHAEDMRAFTLKREAIAASSLTLEENDAYQETLLMIAGDPLLARTGTLPLEVGDAPSPRATKRPGANTEEEAS